MVIDFVLPQIRPFFIHPLFYCAMGIIYLVYIINNFFKFEKNKINIYADKEYELKYNLSNRETEITNLVIQGKSNKEIAVMLNISLSTVKNHLHNIFEKTNANSRFEIISSMNANNN